MCAGRIEDTIQISRTATVMKLDTKQSITVYSFMYMEFIWQARYSLLIQIMQNKCMESNLGLYSFLHEKLFQQLQLIKSFT